MSIGGTTDLADLPCEGDNPIQLHTSDVEPPPSKTGADDINTLVTGIQAASASGALQLPACDVPQEQEHLSRDVNTRVNYIPEKGEDYISNVSPVTENKPQVKQTSNEGIGEIIESIQAPMLLAILYFGFHMPVLRRLIYNKLPFLFGKDGSSSTVGTAITSIAFAGCYIGLRKMLEFLST